MDFEPTWEDLKRYNDENRLSEEQSTKQMLKGDRT